MLHTIRFKIFMLSALFTIILLIAIAVAASSCAPDPSYRVNVTENQTNYGKTVEFMSDPANPGFECGIVRSISGYIQQISCSYK